jgi:catechol 2,3-dioxygenase-like lactoylglutathione lyase family enzyme
MAAAPGIDGIIQIAISVGDIDRAVAFYRDVLGLELVMTAPPGLAFLRCGDVRLMLSAASEEGETRSDPLIYFRVPDVQRAVEALRQRGATFAEEAHVIARLEKVDVWLAATEDPDGHIVGLMCEVPRS